VLGPVAESIDAPQPVLPKVLLSGGCEIYTQFMDLRNFNVTQAAPNLINAYYGFSPIDPEVLNAKQYGFTYAVFPPFNDTGCGPAADYSVLVTLHGYGGHAVRPWTFDPEPTWCNTFRIYPIDVTNTWWFGNARDHDFRVDLDPLSGDTVVNYTEQRVLRMIRDLKASPTYGSMVDEERVYVRGHSMGGSGALAFALRYPNVFAGAHASQPMTNYITDGDGGGTDWRPDLEIKWGTVAEELPMLSDAMDGLADHLKQYDGTPTWEWQNHQQQLIDRRGEDFVPFGIDHGIPDLVIEWATQGLPFYEPLNEASICWSGQVTNDLHVSSDLASLPASMAKTPAGHPFAGFMVKRSESLPGFRDATGNNALPPVGSGAYNEFIEWSSSWGPWDGQPLDTALEWQISLRTTDASIHTADIIPRRLQSFSTTAGWGYAWSNTRVSDGVEIASGTVMADADGLVIVPDVEITPSGNRVRVAPLLSGSPAQISVSAGGAQTLALDCGDDLAGKLALVLGSVSGTSPGVPVNSSLTLPLNLDPYFILTLNQPNSAFLTPSLAGLDPVGNMVTTFTLGAGIAPGLVGLAAHHAFAVIDSLGGSAVITAVSNPVSVSFDP